MFRPSKVRIDSRFQIKENGPILDHVRSFLPFRDICVSRGVCRDWLDTRNIRVEETVFFINDGAPVNFPNNDHKEFRKCLQAMKLLKLHCEIPSQEHLDFLCTIVRDASHIHLELDGDQSDSFQSGVRPPQWEANVLNNLAPQLLSLQLLFFNIPEQFVNLNFSVLPRLESFKSNGKFVVQNYDDRPMKSFGCVIDFWSAMATKIANNSQTISLQNDFQQGPDFANFWLNWKPNHSQKVVFCSSDSEPFMEVGPDESGTLQLQFHDPFGLGDFELENQEYQKVLRHVLTRFPHIIVQYVERDSLQKWHDIICPVFEEFSLSLPEPKFATPASA